MSESAIITTNNVNLWYNEKRALESVSMTIPKNKVTALIGPSGCGKSTLLRCFNRLNDLIDHVRIQLAGLALSAAIMHVAVHLQRWSPYAGLALSIALVPPVTFALSRWWVFRA